MTDCCGHCTALLTSLQSLSIPLFAGNACCTWFTTTLPRVTLHSKCCLPADSFAGGYKGSTPLLHLGKLWRAVSQQQSSSEDILRLYCRPPLLSSHLPLYFLSGIAPESCSQKNLHAILCLICFQESKAKRWKWRTTVKGMCDVVMASPHDMSSEDELRP